MPGTRPPSAVAAFSLIYENEPKIKKLNWFCVLLTFVCQGAFLLSPSVLAFCALFQPVDFVVTLFMHAWICVYIIENTRTQIRRIKRGDERGNKYGPRKIQSEIYTRPPET